MPTLDCLFHFHCGQPAGSDEHVFPAALAGRRTDRRLICEDCQRWTSKLDEVLPDQLRYLNLHLGVVGDHQKKPARLTIKDPDTGHQLLLDEKMGIEARGSKLVAEDTDEKGYTVRRYNFASKAEGRRVLDELRAQGIKVDVLNQAVAPLLRTKPLTSGLEFGGREGMRAAARVALNFLAMREPDTARAAQLEPFKRWILSGEPEVSDFVNYGGVLPPPFRIANQYEFGHRVVLGLDPDEGVFARISFFDTYDLSVRLGPNVPGPRRYYVWDLDPTARHRRPDIDRIERNLDGVLEHSPRVLGDVAATSAEVCDRVQAGSDRILSAARARIDREHVERLARQLSRLATIRSGRRREQVQRLLRPELQCATNLVARVAPIVENQICAAGYSWTARYLHALMDCDVPEFIVPLSENVLAELESVMMDLVEGEEVAAERIRDVLFGMTGHVIASKVLFRTLEAMRIWYRGEGPEVPTPAWSARSPSAQTWPVPVDQPRRR